MVRPRATHGARASSATTDGDEARSVMDQLSGPIASKQQTVDQRVTEIEQKLQQVLDKRRAQ